MARISALVLSVVFQPLMMPTLVFGLLLFGLPYATDLGEEFKLRILLAIVISTLVIPMVTIVGLRLSGTVKSLHMETIQDRTIPFTVTSIYFLITAYFLFKVAGAYPVLWQSLAVISLVVISLTLVTYFWKMSAHMTGMGGLVAILMVMGIRFPLFQWIPPMLLALILAGMVGTARLYLQVHRPSEVYAGFAFGFAISFLGFMWVWM